MVRAAGLLPVEVLTISPVSCIPQGYHHQKKTSGLLCPITHRHGNQNPSMNLSPATSNQADQWRIFSSRVPSLESLRIHQVLGLTYSAAVLRLHRLSLILLFQRTFLVKKASPRFYSRPWSYKERCENWLLFLMKKFQRQM